MSAAVFEDSGDLMIVLVFVGWVVIGGGVGALIGQSKDRVPEGILLGLLLGAIGWIIVALMEPDPRERRLRDAEVAEAMAAAQARAGVQVVGAAPVERVCPFCAETIKAAAVLCRFCGRDIEPLPPRS